MPSRRSSALPRPVTHEPGRLYSLADDLSRLLAPNPSPYTGEGTWVHLIGTDRLAILDPGRGHRVQEGGLGEVRGAGCRAPDGGGLVHRQLGDLGGRGDERDRERRDGDRMDGPAHRSSRGSV